MKVWITTTAYRDRQWLPAAEPLIRQATANVEGASSRRFALANSPETADLIVYVEPGYDKLRRYYDLLYSEDLVRRFPNRCFVIECGDVSWGIAPGIYTHLHARQLTPGRLRSGGFLRMYNDQVERVWSARSSFEPTLVASFRGFASSPVRQAIFDKLPSSARMPITQTFSWMNHSDTEKVAYLEEMRASRFVLCPRGAGTSTYRLFETMQLGRVPVILADDWPAPIGVPWQDFSIRVSESRVADLPEILGRFEPFADEMGSAARRVWEHWYGPDVVFVRMLESLEGMCLERPADHDERAIAWRSFGARWSRRWTAPQRLVDAIAAGRVRDTARHGLARLLRRTPV